MKDPVEASARREESVPEGMSIGDVATDARRLWWLYEALHDVIYFADEPRQAAEDIGLRGFWMGYFAFRAAPLGMVGPVPVTAMFYGFRSDRPARALPDAWNYASPDLVLTTRLAAAASALRRICGASVMSNLDEAVDLAGRAAQLTDVAGRPLGAANREVPVPSDPVGALWQAATTLREHRGDGHVATLVARGIPPVEAHIMKVASGENTDADLLRQARNWSDQEWQHGVTAVMERGWCDDDVRLTDEGRREHDEIERSTDRAAARPWVLLGTAETARLAELLEPLARAVRSSGVLPQGNPTGLPSGDPVRERFDD